MKLQLIYWRSFAPFRAEVLTHCATEAAQAAEVRPIQRLFLKRASLTAALAAATLLAACGGGSIGSSGDPGAGLSATPAVAVASAPSASSVGISGTAQVGQLLTGSYSYADANNDPQGSSTFRWLRSGVAIAGATARTYTLVGADQGNTLTFEVTPVSTVAPTTGVPVTSGATAVVTGADVVITPAAPTAGSVGISGTAQVGQLLTGNYTYADANNDPQGNSTFRWLRSGVAIAGATARTYTLVGADQGSTLTFEVTPVSTVAPTTGAPVSSGATAAVTAAAAAPTAGSVAISGTAQVGQLLTGNYTYADANNDPQGSSTFRWLRSGVAIAGATARTYTLVGADQGSTLTFEVTPVSTVAPTTGVPVLSGATAVVTAAAAAPTASSVAITGTAQVGQLLTGNYSYADANNDPQGVSTFRWLRNGVAIAGATAPTYMLGGADQGNTLTFEVTPVSTVAPTMGTPVSSGATAAVTAAAAAPTASSVAISGTARVGQLLTGNYTYADANNDPQGSSTFRWLRSGVAIAGATARTYTLVSADQGNTLTFEVTPVSTVAPTTGVAVLSAGVNVAIKSVGMKLLVISTEGTAPSYLATLSILDQIGVPYDKIVLKGTNATALQMVAGTLSDGAAAGKYQGIILETGDLAAFNAPTSNYPSAMTTAQWAILRQYQVDFGVRSATMYTRPALTIDVNNLPLDLSYGLGSAVELTATDANPIVASFTPLGQQSFGYLNQASPISLKGNIFTYPATPVSSATVPLLQMADTRSIVSVHTAPAGWQNLAIAADNNPELTHTLLLGYGVVNWVTRGVFLGERKIYLSAQPDDVFIPDDLWDPVTKTTPAGNSIFRHRNNGTDYNSLVAWQTALQSNSQTAAFRLELPFNGVGYNTTDTGYLNQGELTDSLSPAVRANPNAFRWINHTWDHSSLNPTDPSNPGFVPLTVATMKQKFQLNHDVASGLGTSPVTFALYNKNAFIQPDISGLANPVFWKAAQEFGFRYILMDTSKTYDFRPTLAPIAPNAGFYSTGDTFVPGNPRILIIPRYPTNLYYNVSTPQEWVSEYNYFFGATGVVPPPPGQTSWFGGDATYEQILDRESEVLLRYMLKYNANSWMFHAANLRDYDGAGPNNKSVLSDLLDAVATKYKAMYSLPVLSPSQTEIGQLMEARMAYNTALTGGLKGRIVYGPLVTIELTNPSSASVKVPMTGINVAGNVTTYGGQTVSTVTLAAGASASIAAP